MEVAPPYKLITLLTQLKPPPLLTLILCKNALFYYDGLGQNIAHAGLWELYGVRVVDGMDGMGSYPLDCDDYSSLVPRAPAVLKF